MPSPSKTRRLNGLLKRLSDTDGAISYRAFLEADTLSDDSLLMLLSRSRRISCVARSLAAPGRAASWIAIAVALISISVVVGMHSVTVASCLLLITIVAGLTFSQLSGHGASDDNARATFDRNLARLLAHRTDGRFLAHVISMHSRTNDLETSDYLKLAVRSMLETSNEETCRAIRLHQTFFARILLRPLRDVRLTLAVLSAFGEAGNARALAYVRALAFVFEGDLRNRQLRHDECSCRFEPLQTDDFGRGRVRVGVPGNVWIKRREGGKSKRSPHPRSDDGSYVPHLSHVDEDGLPLPPPNLTMESAAQLRCIIQAARQCEAVMVERLIREEQAWSLLKPSSRPLNPVDELVRPAGFQRESVRELLRPGVR